MSRAIRWLLALGFAALTAEFVALLFWRGTLHIARNRSEGWNAYHAQAVFDGTALYHPAGALVANNYPPLSFLLTAGVMHGGLDAVFAGRLIAAVAFLACALLIGGIVFARTGEGFAALVSASLFAAWMAVHQPEWVGIDDPQLLGHALLLAGLLVLVRGEAFATPLLAGVLCAAGLFAKHNLVALPLAVLVWQVRARPWRGALFVLGGVGAALAAFLVCNAVYGPDFLDGMLAPRAISAARAWRLLLLNAAALAPLLCVGALGLTARDSGHWDLFIGAYLVLGIGFGLAQFAGEGVNGHAIDDAVIAACLGAGSLLARVPRKLPALLACLAAVLAAGPDLADAKDMLQPRAWMALQRARAEDTGRMVALIAAAPGEAICDTAVYCYWAGKRQAVDSFHLDQLVARGLTDGRDLLAAVQAGGFAVVTLLPDQKDALATVLADELRARYTPALTLPGQQVAFVRAP